MDTPLTLEWLRARDPNVPAMPYHSARGQEPESEKKGKSKKRKSLAETAREEPVREDEEEDLAPEKEKRRKKEKKRSLHETAHESHLAENAEEELLPERKDKKRKKTKSLRQSLESIGHSQISHQSLEFSPSQHVDEAAGAANGAARVQSPTARKSSPRKNKDIDHEIAITIAEEEIEVPSSIMASKKRSHRDSNSRSPKRRRARSRSTAEDEAETTAYTKIGPENDVVENSQVSHFGDHGEGAQGRNLVEAPPDGEGALGDPDSPTAARKRRRDRAASSQPAVSLLDGDEAVAGQASDPDLGMDVDNADSLPSRLGNLLFTKSENEGDSPEEHGSIDFNAIESKSLGFNKTDEAEDDEMPDVGGPNGTSRLRTDDGENDDIDARGPSEDEEEEMRTSFVPPATSAKTPKSQKGKSRRPKEPFFSRERLEITRAFAELPLDGAATSPEPTRATTFQLHASIKDKQSVSSGTLERRSKKPEVAAASDVDGRFPRDKGHRSGDKKMIQSEEPESHYRMGPLSETERHQITAAVDTFRETQGLTWQELVTLIHERLNGDNNTVRHLLAAVQNACPSRPRKKLMEWCRQTWHKFVARGVWTEEQDEELLGLYKIHGKQWSKIGGIINRHQKDVRDRYRNYLACGGKANKDAWTEEEEKQLLEAVEHAIDAIKDQSPNEPVDKLINWEMISNAMNQKRTRLQCLDKWRRMGAAGALPDRIITKLPSGSSWRQDKARRQLRQVTAQDRFQLAEAIRFSDVLEDSKIKWKQIVEDTFNNRYLRQVLKVTWGRLREAVPGWEEKSTLQCARHICSMFEKDGNFGGIQDVDDEVVEESEHEPTSKPERRSEPEPASEPEPEPEPRTLGLTRKKHLAREQDALMSSAGTSKKSRKHRRPSNASEEVEEGVPRDMELDTAPEAEADMDVETASVDLGITTQDSASQYSQELPQLPKPSSGSEIPKRSRRNSSGFAAEQPSPKKRKKVKQITTPVKNKKASKEEKATDGRRSQSYGVVSSDMDDMEDIPAE
ncbi:hypothetical protein B0T19DRAFT_405548 [Cercophora scortea]|uniref:Myb transcription factor n=1 Tax=Cercophora scortea TaxID=314031 RepID=A0AAE0I3H0_9PEZI|nr:hypothetical protein B0T19DRAFT_405548 [Cercophora scortea]